MLLAWASTGFDERIPKVPGECAELRTVSQCTRGEFEWRPIGAAVHSVTSQVRGVLAMAELDEFGDDDEADEYAEDADDGAEEDDYFATLAREELSRATDCACGAEFVWLEFKVLGSTAAAAETSYMPRERVRGGLRQP